MNKMNFANTAYIAACKIWYTNDKECEWVDLTPSTIPPCVHETLSSYLKDHLCLRLLFFVDMRDLYRDDMDVICEYWDGISCWKDQITFYGDGSYKRNAHVSFKNFEYIGR